VYICAINQTLKHKAMKKQILESMMSRIAGIKVELCIRGERSFTFHFEGCNNYAMNAIVKYFSKDAKSIEAEYDVECDMTCVFLEV
jgi:hypothetical protein